MFFTVTTRLELNKLNTEIEKIDPNAFIVMNSVKDTKGGMVKKRSLKHKRKRTSFSRKKNETNFEAGMALFSFGFSSFFSFNIWQFLGIK